MSLNAFRISLVFPLLLLSNGFASSGRETIKLTQVVQWSDAILLVSKRKPYLIERRYKVSDGAKEEYGTTTYSFDIISVIETSLDTLRRMKTIEVHAASSEDNFEDFKHLIEGGPNRMRIHRYYASGKPGVDDAKEFVIFIRYNETSGWYSFTAGGAMESKDALKLRKGWYPPGPQRREPE